MEDVGADYRDDEIIPLIHVTAGGLYLVTLLLTKHFGLDKEQEVTHQLFGDWAQKAQGTAAGLSV